MRSSVGALAVAFWVLSSSAAGAIDADVADRQTTVGSRTSSQPAGHPDVVVAFTGDTLVHLNVVSNAARHGSPYDFGPLFSDVRHIIGRADLALCHLEVPLTRDDHGFSAFPLFKAPGQLAEGLAAAGFDGCSTASNHSYDQGAGGVEETISILEDAGLGQAGMSHVPDLGWEAALYDVGELTIAHVSGTYWLNGLRMPTDQPWLVQLLDPDQMIHAAARAKGAGADLVVASMHCCTEYVHQPTPTQLEISHLLIESPYIDLVVSHHSHVVGPIERVGDEFIIHGLGNFISGQTHTEPTRDGVIALATAGFHWGSWRFESIDVVPTQVQRGTSKAVPAEPGGPSFNRTMAVINSMGAGIGVYQPRGLTEAQRRLIQ